jgi:hypothetical protein
LFVDPFPGLKLLGTKPAVCHSARASSTVSVEPGTTPSTRFGTGANPATQGAADAEAEADADADADADAEAEADADADAEALDDGTYVAAGGIDCWSAATLADIVMLFPTTAPRTGIMKLKALVIRTFERVLPCGVAEQATAVPDKFSQETLISPAVTVTPDPRDSATIAQPISLVAAYAGQAPV